MPQRLLLCLTVMGLVLPGVLCGKTLPVVGHHPTDTVITSASFIDQNRLDPFSKDGRPRKLMISGFSPFPACERKHLEPYMPPGTASFQDSKFATYGLPNGSIKSLFLQTCERTAYTRPCPTGGLPLALFSGALGTSRMIYHSMLQSIAAAGYLVVSVDHPYNSDIVEFPDGTIITGIDISDTQLEDAMATRAEDIAFLYEQLKKKSVRRTLFPNHHHRKGLPKTAAFGHSFGGAAIAAAMQKLTFIRGGVNIDGTMFGSVLVDGLDQPFMLIGHENKTQATDPSWKAAWPNLRGWKKEVEVKGAAHYSFSDLPLITSILGLEQKLPSEEVTEVLGVIAGRRMMELSVAYLTTFLDMALKSGSEKEFSKANRKFSEVVSVA